MQKLKKTKKKKKLKRDKNCKKKSKEYISRIFNTHYQITVYVHIEIDLTWGSRSLYSTLSLSSNCFTKFRTRRYIRTEFIQVRL